MTSPSVACGRVALWVVRCWAALAFRALPAPQSAADPLSCSSALPQSRSASLSGQLQGPGLATVLETRDFSCWEAATASTLGHHRSELASAAEPFEARFRVGELGGFGVLHLKGRGRLRLIREQRQQSVLWLPLRGMTQECVNGHTWLAEPGAGLLLHPGDQLEGDTSEELEGLSILIPETLHAPPEGPVTPLLAAGPLHQRLLHSSRQLALAAALRPAGAEHPADQLREALHAWSWSQQQPQPRERITARRRRELVERARLWMAPRLAERFSLLELSAVLEVSPRQLQYSFKEELGRTPMAEAKRLRLQRLRQLLLDPEQGAASVAELMAASGLIASGVTSADYRRWYGESPRRTRLQRRAEG